MFWMSLIFCQEIFELFCHLFLNVRHCFLKWTVGMDFVVSFSHSYYNMQLNMKNITISSSCNISVLSMPFCNHVTFGSVQKIMALFFCIMHYIQPIMVGITNQACLFISLWVKQIREFRCSNMGWVMESDESMIGVCSCVIKWAHIIMHDAHKLLVDLSKWTCSYVLCISIFLAYIYAIKPILKVKFVIDSLHKISECCFQQICAQWHC